MPSVPVLEQLEATTARLSEALTELDVEGLLADSALPGWSRLTIVCHLRYGARALQSMTTDAEAGREASFYPGGRAGQRPTTLTPDDGESPHEALRSLAEESRALHSLWKQVSDWNLRVHEPAENADLGPIRLSDLAVLRLTEVEVHATDLQIGLGPWSDAFIDHALPMRLAWLPLRRRNRQLADRDLRRSWLFVRSEDGSAWRVHLSCGAVSTSRAGADDEADAVIEATGRELLGFMLGRNDLGGTNDFLSVFPPP